LFSKIFSIISFAFVKSQLYSLHRHVLSGLQEAVTEKSEGFLNADEMQYSDANISILMIERVVRTGFEFMNLH